ncbi:hypothetical protein LCGC14_0686900 [marine sediment metagenome]|uniref:Uncharacterized protein n=1 Tax=marine sediment metagenome TaxID=412755 RepID=A0A0F9QLK4_9ZZZZ
MWWKTQVGRYINTKHIASITVSKVKDKWCVYAYEVMQQSQYVIREFDTKWAAENLAGELTRADK